MGLSHERLDLGALYEHVLDDACGAVSTFVGTTRDCFDGNEVVELEYEAYEALAEKEMRALVERARAKWALVHVAIFHRLGRVPVREASVAIAVSSVHRSPALEAARWLIDSLKAQVPIWKKEKYKDGSAWKQNTEFDPQQLLHNKAEAGAD